MGYPRRIIQHEKPTRCSTKTNRWEELFTDPEIRKLVYLAIDDVKKTSTFEVLHVDFKSDELVIIIKTFKDQEIISNIMQRVKCRVSKWYNKKLGLIGSFWHERFKSHILEDFSKNDGKKSDYFGSSQENPAAESPKNLLESCMTHLCNSTIFRGLTQNYTLTECIEH